MTFTFSTITDAENFAARTRRRQWTARQRGPSVYIVTTDDEQRTEAILIARSYRLEAIDGVPASDGMERLEGWLWCEEQKIPHSTYANCPHIHGALYVLEI